MSYSSNYVKHGRKQLLVLSVVSLLSLLFAGTLFYRQMGRQNGWKTTKGIEKLSIVNVSPHGFDIAWSTKDQVLDDQWIEWGTRKDDFKTKKSPEYINGIYYAKVTGLSANTTYHFRVRKGVYTYELSNLIVTTIRTPKSVKEKPISPAYGKAILPSGKPYMNGLLIYEIDGFYPLAVFTKETGEWLLPLTGLIEKKSNAIQTVSDTAPVSLKLFSYPDGIVRTTMIQTRPLRQAITAGISLRLAQVIQEGKVLGESSQQSAPDIKGQPRIIYPKENGIIPGNTPLIRGVGVALKDVIVLIQGPTKQYSYRTKADERGDWLVKYPLALENGRYTIAASTVDKSGAPLTVRRSFTIIKSGEQVLGSATGSPTLVPTAPPVPTTTSPTIAPTKAQVYPTLTPYPTSIVPTRLIPTATPPVSGGGMSGFLFMALFCIVIGTGLVLAF